MGSGPIRYIPDLMIYVVELPLVSCLCLSALPTRIIKLQHMFWRITESLVKISSPTEIIQAIQIRRIPRGSIRLTQFKVGLRWRKVYGKLLAQLKASENPHARWVALSSLHIKCNGWEQKMQRVTGLNTVCIKYSTRILRANKCEWILSLSTQHPNWIHWILSTEYGLAISKLNTLSTEVDECTEYWIGSSTEYCE